MVHGKVPVCVFVDVSNKQMLSDSNTEQVTARRKRFRAPDLFGQSSFLRGSVPPKTPWQEYVAELSLGAAAALL